MKHEAGVQALDAQGEAFGVERDFSLMEAVSAQQEALAPVEAQYAGDFTPSNTTLGVNAEGQTGRGDTNEAGLLRKVVGVTIHGIPAIVGGVFGFPAAGVQWLCYITIGGLYAITENTKIGRGIAVPFMVVAAFFLGVSMPIRYIGLYPVDMLMESFGKDDPKWRNTP